VISEGIGTEAILDRTRPVDDKDEKTKEFQRTTALSTAKGRTGTVRGYRLGQLVELCGAHQERQRVEGRKVDGVRGTV